MVADINKSGGAASSFVADATKEDAGLLGRMLALSGRLGGYKIEGYWRGIDTVKDLKEANADYITDEE